MNQAGTSGPVGPMRLEVEGNLIILKTFLMALMVLIDQDFKMLLLEPVH